MPCTRDAECGSNLCGILNSTTTACCSDVYAHNGERYCKEIPESKECYFDDTCSTGVCLAGKNLDNATGTCQTKVTEGKECFGLDRSTVECSATLECGYKSAIGLPAAGYICCNSTHNGICKGAIDGTVCQYDETCENGICFNLNVTSPHGVCRGKV